MEHQTVFESREERMTDGRAVDKNQDSNMVGGMGGLTGFSDLADGQERADMQDPAAIMSNVAGSLEGYQARLALEEGESRRGGSSETPDVSMLELFNKPHSFAGGRPGMKAIKAGKPR